MRPMYRMAPAAILAAVAMALVSTGQFGCDPPKTRMEKRVETAQATRMAHVRLEVWQEARLQSLDGRDGAEQINVLKTYSTEPIAFEFWVGGGSDVKSLCIQPTFGGRTAFLRFADLVLHARSIDASGWGFDINTEMETASGTTMSGWPYTAHSPINMEVGKPLEIRLSGFSDVTREPEALYIPVVRLSLLEIANSYGEKVKHEGRLKIPDDVKKLIEADRNQLAKNLHPTTQSRN